MRVESPTLFAHAINLAGQDLETWLDYIAGPEADARVYVSSVGDDSWSGLRTFEPVATINQAITIAAALQGAGAGDVCISVIDGNTYTENLALTNGMHLDMPNATLVGTLSLAGRVHASVGYHYASANSQVSVATAGSDARAAYYANNLDTRGQAGSFTGGTGVQCAGNGAILFARIDKLYVAANGFGITDVSAGAGHVHFWAPDLYLTGNSATGVRLQSPNSDFIGTVDHILDFGSPTGTTGVRQQNGLFRLGAREIVAATAYNITGGAFHLFNIRTVGTRTGASAVELSDVELRGAWGQLNSTGGILTGTSRLRVPVGTTAQRPGSPAAGDVRYNTSLSQYEGWNGSTWVAFGAGAGANVPTGGGSDEVFYENDQLVTTDYTLTAGKNAMSAGPITINTGATVTVPSGAVWTVV